MAEILIIGGGFAGVWAALAATREIKENKADIDVTLISKEDFMTIRPRLYEKNPKSLTFPLSQTLDPVCVNFIRGTVKTIDTEAQFVVCDGIGGEIKKRFFDRLILATGSQMPELNIPGLKEHSWNIDDYTSSIALDAHLGEILQAPKTSGHNTFVILGAGFTGIELATELRSRIAGHSDDETASNAQIILVEQASFPGPELGANARPIITEALKEANVEVFLGTKIDSITPNTIFLSDGNIIESKTAIITVGLRASPLTEALNTDRDKLNRVFTNDELQVKGLSNVFAAGDAAQARVDENHTALMSCQHAMTMGKYAGYNAVRDLLNLPLRPYRQPNYVTCLHLGDYGALLTKGWDRKVEQTGLEVRKLKTKINTVWIYPPTGSREQILSASGIDD